jgi:hypothetical protein
MRIDGLTDRHDEANSHFSQFLVLRLHVIQIEILLCICERAVSI